VTDGRPLPFDVEVVRSRRRRKTVGGRMSGNVLTVTVPSWMSKVDTATAVDDIVRRFARRHSTERIDLAGRAARLAARHDLPRARDIGWSDGMRRSRWASCTPSEGSIRISTRLAPFPSFVVDYVIVHELAHLAVSDHSPHFWELVERFPMTERARGYLMAKSGDAEDEAF
jgi:predicted metal-dependent hydrolase